MTQNEQTKHQNARNHEVFFMINKCHLEMNLFVSSSIEQKQMNN